jgi:DMSO/TMAO reductase YedYZ molybdopterin-dependent catalytic subunit
VYFIGILLAFAPLFLPAQQDSLAQFVSKRMTITGKVAKPLTLKLNDLTEFTLHTVKNTPIISLNGNRKGTIRTCKGVLLRDVLDKVGIVVEEKRDFNRLSKWSKAIL